MIPSQFLKSKRMIKTIVGNQASETILDLCEKTSSHLKETLPVQFLKTKRMIKNIVSNQTSESILDLCEKTSSHLRETFKSGMNMSFFGKAHILSREAIESPKKQPKSNQINCQIKCINFFYIFKTCYLL
jgi:hypothetical protein